ncbi:MAG: adenylate/guanylate cyclase domain-containing protein [Chthoniobacterales bacterium]
MSDEEESRVRLEIGHVLFIDIVGYSKLLIDEEKKWLRQLTEIVLATAQVREATNEQLVRLPTGDGMALVFRNSSEEPAQCALEPAQALREHPEIRVRMGVHSGPVSEVIDLNGRINIAGDGINMAQRVMDCGDAGHILLSKRVADDLATYRHWLSQLHDLGECEVKHGVRVHVFNLYTDEAGNSELPAKLRLASTAAKNSVRKYLLLLSVVVVAVLIGFLIFSRARQSGESVRGEDRAHGAAGLAIPEKSIAVLPMVNESGLKDEQYFSDGLSEDLMTALSQFTGLKVIGRNSAFQFRDTRDDARTIGAKLGVAHLLEGSVRRAGDMVRIRAELIKASDSSTLWSQQYDRPYKDLFALQDDITRAVAGALQAKLLLSKGAKVQSDHPPSGNLAAYTAYLQGKFYFERGTEADYRQAIAQDTAAIRLDPRYALAYAELSHTWAALTVQFLDSEPAQQAYAEGRLAAETALALEPDLAAAHIARGYLIRIADFDWSGSEAEYRRALQLAPNDGQGTFSLGNVLAALGQPQRAVTLTREALATDPLNARWYDWLSSYLSGLGRLDEAEGATRKAIELQPAAVSYHETLTIIEIQRGDAKAALAAAQAEPASGGWQEIALALAQQIGSDRAAADAALKTLIDTQADAAPYQIAEVYALRQDPEKVFAWLDRAWAVRDPGINDLLYHPFILRYQHDPRFAAFCRKVGLPAPVAETKP